MSRFQYTAKSHHLQWNVRQLSQICHHFYQNYCPDSFKHRRNVGLAKVSDEALLVLLLLQAELGITSQRHFYTICHPFPCGQLLERSRFNLRSKHWFYGIKVHMLVTLSGYILNYVVTPTSVHNIKVVCELLEGCKQSVILGDLGYLSSELKKDLEQEGYPSMDAISTKHGRS